MLYRVGRIIATAPFGVKSLIFGGCKVLAEVIGLAALVLAVRIPPGKNIAVPCRAGAWCFIGLVCCLLNILNGLSRAKAAAVSVKGGPIGIGAPQRVDICFFFSDLCILVQSMKRYPLREGSCGYWLISPKVCWYFTA